MFRNTAVGLEITPEGIRMASVEGRREQPRIIGHGARLFPPETVRFSLREPNILVPEQFIKVVRDTSLPLLAKTPRVAVSLPDSTGRVILLDLETRFKNRDEGSDIIRWKLKKSFPFNINEAHLDYQMLAERETGEISVLVSLISRQVINQYEELLVEAGLEPYRIDFTSFNIYRLFASRLEVATDCAVIFWQAGVLSMLIFGGGILEFFRSKEIPGETLEVNRIFREINNSLLVFQDRHPGYLFKEVFCMAGVGEGELLKEVVAEATSQQPILLDVERLIDGSGNRVDRATLHDLKGALGAAVWSLR